MPLPIRFVGRTCSLVAQKSGFSVRQVSGRFRTRAFPPSPPDSILHHDQAPIGCPKTCIVVNKYVE